MDYSFLAGLGSGITHGVQGFNEAQQREYAGQQQEFENQRQQALLGLALAKQQLDEQNAADTRTNTQFEHNRQTQQDQFAQQKNNQQLLPQYRGRVLSPDQVAGFDLGAGKSLMLSPAAPTPYEAMSPSNLQIAPSKSASPTSPQTPQDLSIAPMFQPGSMRVNSTSDQDAADLAAALQARTLQQTGQLRQDTLAEKIRNDTQQSEDKRFRDNMLGSIAASNLQARRDQQAQGNDNKLATMYQRDNKGATDAILGHQRMQQAYALLKDPNTPLEDRSAAEAAMYEGAQKIVNPGMSVRAQQAKLYTDNQSLPARFRVALKNWVQGGKLDMGTVDSLMATADKTIQPSIQYYRGNYKRYGDKASDKAFVLGEDLTQGYGQPGVPAGGAGTGGAPAVGTKRVINGQPAVWDGHGWTAQ